MDPPPPHEIYYCSTHPHYNFWSNCTVSSMNHDMASNRRGSDDASNNGEVIPHVDQGNAKLGNANNVNRINIKKMRYPNNKNIMLIIKS